MENQRFADMYEGQAPWDIGRPQPEIVKLAEAGLIHGRVLDVGCGTGENALYVAGKGNDVCGVDFVPAAIERAKAKAAQRSIDAHFVVGNALELEKLNKQFDTVVDSFLFHTLPDEERPTYVQSLTKVLRQGGLLCLLCFSDEEPGTEGPRRVSQKELRDAFHDGWTIKQIVPIRAATVLPPVGPKFSEGGPKCWLATIERL